MLYLAEVKKQTKGFIGGFKTEIKLLAYQHNDGTWSAVPGEEILVTEEFKQAFGDGNLLSVNLNGSRQIQGQPEPAGIEIVRQLQKWSRLSEKWKEEQEMLERKEQSLIYQLDELERRKDELERREEQMEKMAQDLEQLERRRQEVEEAETRLQEQQRDRQQVNVVLEAARRQQQTFNTYWQELNREKASLEQRQREIEQWRGELNHRQQEFDSNRDALDESKLQLQIQQQLLSSKRELLGRLDLNLETAAELAESCRCLVAGSAEGPEGAKVNLDALESIPLAELEVIVKDLQADWEKDVRFVNDQEEELKWQSEAVRELQVQIATANEFDRIDLERQLGEEQERKNLLDETLIGQRRKLKERQAILVQHLQILRRRQGIIELDDSYPALDLDPIRRQIETWQNSALAERQRLEAEIARLDQNLQHLQETIPQQEARQAERAQELQVEEERWQQAARELAQRQWRLSFSEEVLQPLQDGWDEIRPRLEGLLGSGSSVAEEQPQAIA